MRVDQLELTILAFWVILGYSLILKLRVYTRQVGVPDTTA